MKNQRDENGLLHGLWEEYNPSGKLWYKCHYKHGRENGLWEYYYYHSGKPIYKGAYKRGTQVGLWYESDG